MTWNPELRQFITEHLTDDTTRLLLSGHRYPGIDVPFAVEQIEARCRLRSKLPQWYALDDLIMSGRIPAEQCSSEQTARFKRSIMMPGAESLCDMTGGMGVDFWYMSQGLRRAIYTERQPALCEAARHNFEVLSRVTGAAVQIEVRQGLSTEMPIPDVDVIYLDPARRSSDGARIYEISDCEPDVVGWQEQLLQHCKQLIVKVSPMADISRSLSRLRYVTDVYVVSVRNECKELLFVMQRPLTEAQATTLPDPGYRLHCVDFLKDRTITFEVPDVAGTDHRACPLAAGVGRFFYEPDVSIMKCQAFSSLANRFGLSMFDADCHYFTSDEYCQDFPGRSFIIDESFEFSSKLLKRLRSLVPQANIAARGFVMTADQLRQRSGIRDGGDVFLFGVQLHDKGMFLLRCHKVSE